MAKNDYDDDWAYLWLSGVWSLGQQLVSQRSSRSGSREQVVICRSGEKETSFGFIFRRFSNANLDKAMPSFTFVDRTFQFCFGLMVY